MNRDTDLTQRRMLWLVLVICLVAWFAPFGQRDLIDPDEGRYAEIPREMVASGDWITPRLQGFKYFEKPALQYWMTAAAYTLLGQSSFTARLATAIAGFACLMWMGFVALRLYGAEAGYYSVLIGGSGLLFFGAGHFVTLDMMLTLWLSVGMGSLMLAQQTRSHTQTYMLLAWAALGMGVLSKGLVALVLPTASLVIYMLWQRDWTLWQRMYLGRGLLVLLAVTVPWFVVVSLRNTEFAQFFFIHEHFARYTTSAHKREQPVYFLLSVFALGSLPWLSSSVLALIRPGFAPRADQPTCFDATRLAWVYVVFTLVFFSLSRSQLASYVLPVMPFVALLVARRMQQQLSPLGDAVVALAVGVVLLVAGLLEPKYFAQVARQELLGQLRPYVLFAGGCLMAGGAVLVMLKRRHQVAIAALALATVVAAQSLLVGYQVWAPQRSGRIMAEQIEAMQLPPQTPLYLVGYHSPSLSFYLNRVPTIAMFVGELRMGIDAEPEKCLRAFAQFRERWVADTQAVAVIANRELEKYGPYFPHRVVFRGARSSLIARQ